ncbi:Transcription factor GAMYB [Acorus gramineus]|uniref:Transcription factor GAMYB n=1 Tax=Acorus gramineus TaxID=55184 RepID=A0AAV9BQR0_ACOGR|nr:Transcription factor GAMYB [Acorus gramineus]
MEYVNINGEGSWDAVANRTNLSHSGRSCRLRWYQHLSPRVRNDPFTPTEEIAIIRLHSAMGNNWAGIAAHEAGRSDNQVKNYWNTRIKRCRRTGSPLYQQRQDDPVSHFFQSMELSSVQLEAVVADTNHQPSQENSSGLLQEVVDECSTRRRASDDHHQYHCSNFPITFNYNATVVDPFYQIDWGSMNLGEAVDLLSNEQASLFF